MRGYEDEVGWSLQLEVELERQIDGWVGGAWEWVDMSGWMGGINVLYRIMTTCGYCISVESH